MKILGLLSRKGGVGKTTLAIHLSVLAQQAGRKVLLIDLDPQGSAADWWQAREAAEPAMELTKPPDLPRLLDVARESGVDLVVIDTRPSAEGDALLVAKVADYLLIPARPAILDLRAILKTVDIVKGGRHRASIVLNACPAPRGVGESSATVEARIALKAFGVPIAPVAIVQRTALSHALVNGHAISETEPKGKATKELTALWRYVEKELGDGEATIQPGSGSIRAGRPRPRAGKAGGHSHQHNGADPAGRPESYEARSRRSSRLEGQ